MVSVRGMGRFEESGFSNQRVAGRGVATPVRDRLPPSGAECDTKPAGGHIAVPAPLGDFAEIGGHRLTRGGQEAPPSITGKAGFRSFPSFR